MVHVFLLSIRTDQGIRYDQVTTYLKEHGLIKDIGQASYSNDSAEATVYVYVADREKFSKYYNQRKKRSDDDPRELIVSCYYMGKKYARHPSPEEVKNKRRLKRIRKQNSKSLDNIVF
jgi:hypothetical protein